MKKNVRRKFVLGKLLGAGGKGAVFKAICKNHPAREVVLKFPTFDFTYIDAEASAENALEKLEAHFNTQDAEYKNEFKNSNKLLDKCKCAHVTEDLISISYKFRIGSDRDSVVTVNLQVGVQEFLDPNSWRSLDDWVLPSFKEADLKREHLPDWPLGYIEWVKLAKNIGTALRHIHDRRVVHGDIWAPNVFLRRNTSKFDPDAEVKIIDFGNSWSTEFVSAQLGGKRKDSYAPPEEKRALLPKSEASDAFGFGVLLLWLLTGPDLGKTPETSADDRKKLLLAYLRRKAFDEKVRVLSEITVDRKDTKQNQQLSKLVNGLLEEQVQALKLLLPGDIAVAHLLEFQEKIQKDEDLLMGFLKMSLEKQYTQQSKGDKRLPSKRLEENLDNWTKFRWLKKRMYRPWETAIYDPGQISIENAASQRKLIRKKVWESSAHPIYKKHPWIVDVISRCVTSDQARRPRIMDVLREISTYSAERCDDVDPVEAVSKHRLNVLELKGKVEIDDVHQIDLRESRDMLIEYMSVCLRALKKGDVYAAVTTLDMWQGQALGHDGRFVTANLEALRVGASIRRIFVVSLDELGARFTVKMLILLAKQLKLINEDRNHLGPDAHRITEGLENVSDPHFIEFSSTNCRDDDKRKAFECLFYHVRVALHDQLQANMDPVLKGNFQQEDTPPIIFEQRIATRKRLRMVLDGYMEFVRYFDAVPSLHRIVGTPTFFPRQDRPVRKADVPTAPVLPAFNRNIPGLFLGLRIESSVVKAIKLRATCQRAIIQSASLKQTSKNKRRYVMIETEARNRSREKLMEAPDLNRLRIFYSILNAPPTVQAFQRIMYGTDRINEANGPTHTLPAVNLGCIVPDILEVLAKMNDGNNFSKE